MKKIMVLIMTYYIVSNCLNSIEVILKFTKQFETCNKLINIHDKNTKHNMKCVIFSVI